MTEVALWLLSSLQLLRTNAQHTLHKGSFSKVTLWMEHGYTYFLLYCNTRSCLFRTFMSIQLAHATAPCQSTHSPKRLILQHPRFLILSCYYRNWIYLDFAFAAAREYQGTLCNNLQTVAWEKWDIEKTHFTLWPLYIVTGSVWLGWLPKACGGKKERKTKGKRERS